MIIRFNSNELLEFFESEPVSIAGVETGILFYSWSDNRGFSVLLSMDVYAQRVSIGFSYQNIEIISCGENQVDKVCVQGDILHVIKKSVSVVRIRLANGPWMSIHETIIFWTSGFQR